jgi:RNA polymerase sigma factor (sigma-70 family)
VDDATLLQASAHGDAEAFAAFYRRHLASVLRFCLRQTGSREAAADLTGEVFAAALASCGRYEARHDTATPWLLGIARNKLLESRRRGRVEDAARRRLGIARLELDDDDLARVDELAALGDRPAVSLVEALPSDERAAVRARIVEERDYADIAAELECSESVVRKRVSRGLARVRQQLSTEGKR